MRCVHPHSHLGSTLHEVKDPHLRGHPLLPAGPAAPLVFADLKTLLTEIVIDTKGVSSHPVTSASAVFCLLAVIQSEHKSCLAHQISISIWHEDDGRFLICNLLYHCYMPLWLPLWNFSSTFLPFLMHFLHWSCCFIIVHVSRPQC